jgi:hypothetical protein
VQRPTRCPLRDVGDEACLVANFVRSFDGNGRGVGPLAHHSPQCPVERQRTSRFLQSSEKRCQLRKTAQNGAVERLSCKSGQRGTMSVIESHKAGRLE